MRLIDVARWLLVVGCGCALLCVVCLSLFVVRCCRLVFVGGCVCLFLFRRCLLLFVVAWCVLFACFGIIRRRSLLLVALLFGAGSLLLQFVGIRCLFAIVYCCSFVAARCYVLVVGCGLLLFAVVRS